MKVLLLVTFLSVFGYVVEAQSNRYDIQFFRMGCENRMDLQYSDWVCMTPFRGFLAKKLMVKITLFNENNFLFKQIMVEELMDICKINDLMYIYVYDWQTIKPYLGSSSLTLCPVVEQLPLYIVQFDQSVFPPNLSTGNYRINIAVMDERYNEYFHIDLFIYLRGQQAGIFDFLFG